MAIKPLCLLEIIFRETQMLNRLLNWRLETLPN